MAYYGTTAAENALGNDWSSRNPYRRETLETGASSTDRPESRPQSTYILPTLQGQPTGGSSIRTGATAFPILEKSRSPPLSAEDGWATCLKVMTDYDTALIQGWNENIDGLLILSALISGVVTTFAVEFYTLLQPDSQGSSDALLAQISSQLAFIASNGTISPATISTSSDPGFTPTRSAVYINTLWFMSLTLSLLTAVWGLLVRQWLAKTPLHSGTAVRARVRSHQKRHAALVKWRVGQVVAFLPILLQVSVALFLAGLVQLLWTLNPIVAGFVTIPVTLATAGLASTMILPALADDCPYRSPLSSQITRLIQGLSKLITRSIRRTRLVIPLSFSEGRGARFQHDEQQPALLADKAALQWTQSIVTDGNLIRGIMPCLTGLDREAVLSWVAQERNITTRELVSQIRENHWREGSNEFGDLIGRESLLSIVFIMIHDTADDTPGLGISRMDIVGLFAHLINETSPTSYMAVAQYMNDLLLALENIDLRAHHSTLLSKFMHRCISEDSSLNRDELTSERLLQWALRMFRQLGPLRRAGYQSWGSQEQHAFEYAAAAAITAVSSGYSLPSTGGSHQQAQMRRLFVSLTFFFEHTTLQCPGVDWFPTLRRLFDHAHSMHSAEHADAKETQETVEALQTALESLVALYRGKWIDRLNGIDTDLQYDLLHQPRHATGVHVDLGGELEEELDSDAILGIEVQSLWTGS